MALVGIRDHPESQPRTPDVAKRDDGADQDREDSDGLSAASNRAAPGGIGKTQDRGNQRARMADADPENKIRDVKGPEDGGVNTPDADAVVELITKRRHARKQETGREGHRNPVLSAAVEEWPQQILLDLFSLCLHPANCLVRDKSRSAWCRVLLTTCCRDFHSPVAQLRSWHRSNRRR